MKKFITAIILSMTGCTYGSTSSSEVNQFVKTYNQNLPRLHHLKFDGVGLSMPNNVLKYINLDYAAPYPSDIKQARTLIVQLMETAILNINNDSKLRNFLSHYPFTFNEVTVTVSFMDEKGDFLRKESGSLALVTVAKGKIFYSIKDKPYGFTDVYEEPYLEALKKVTEENQP